MLSDAPSSTRPTPDTRASRWTRMRLFSRLVLSHVLPVLVVTVALALVLAALASMTQQVGELGDDELGSLAREGALHHANWNLDLAVS